MTITSATVLHVLLLIAQGLNVATGFVPVKYKPYAALALGLVQTVVGWIQHKSNPDGSPVTA